MGLRRMVTVGETVKEVSEGRETLHMQRKGKRTLQKMTHVHTALSDSRLSFNGFKRKKPNTKTSLLKMFVLLGIYQKESKTYSRPHKNLLLDVYSIFAHECPNSGATATSSVGERVNKQCCV